MSRYNVNDLTDAEIEYYSRQMILKEVGVEGQLKLKKAKVCIVGLGGLGSPISIQLASMGVGHLRIVDRDVVEISNLQRQHLYGIDVLGYPKVEAAAKRLRKLNPFIEVEPIPTALRATNAEKLIEGVDVVVDGLDRMAPRYILNRTCVKLGIPYVYGSAITHVGNVSTIVPGETACLECFQGGINDANLPTCAVVGVNPSIINVIASIQASEVVKIILGEKPSLANTLLFCDLISLSFDKISLVKAESCPVCGSKPSNKPYKLEDNLIEEVCGRDGKRVLIFTPEEDVDLEMQNINKKIEKLGYTVTVKADMGSTFTKNMKKRGSILKSGVTILEGFDRRELEEFREAILCGDQ
ncbi:HesA/MoeB/ThiF family protein [Candidatus Bathyarchaeota archaeon]|nr:HesA/MoeB/ThiF family protein [Candidatus Bathyarchaeota archaeon]